MAQIRAILKDVTEEQKAEFKNSECLLLISVGQESHEAERFSATIDLINSSFKACTISLYDSIQRHTMALNSLKKPEDFHDIAKRQGDLWLERNKKYYERLEALKGITRWDIWLEHPKYISQKALLKDLINSDPSYKAIFDNTVKTYLERYCKRLNETELLNFDRVRADALCFEYLIEECTVLCLWAELNCQYEVYPNWHNDAIEETRKRFIIPFYPKLLHAVRVGFRNAKQIKPQNFELL